MNRKIHVSITIDPQHPLIELLGGIGPARTLLRALGDATLRGLAHTDPDLAEATRLQVDIVRREAGAELDKASNLPITTETTELVLRLRARLGALETVERALRPTHTISTIEELRPGWSQEEKT